MKIHPEKLAHSTKISEHSFFNKELIEANSDPFLLRKICHSLEAKYLHFAASIDEVELINRTLEGRPTDIDCLDKHGQTPLHYAALRSCEGAVEALLSRGSRIDLKNNDGDTAFDLAIRNPHEKILEMIVKRKLHLDSEFFEAVVVNLDFEKAKTFLAKGADINNRDESGNTVLHYVVANGEVEFVAELLKAGADADAENKDRDTPLHYATLINCERKVETLLSGGSRIDAKNKDGYTAFDLARKNNHQKIIEMINQRKLHLNSEFFKAALLDLNFEKAKTFLAKGANVNIRDESGNTALHNAAAYGEVEFVVELLKAGADVNIRDKSGNTALHHAATNGEVESVVELLKARADAEAKNKAHYTPLHCAVIYSETSVVEALLGKTEFRQPAHLIKRRIEAKNIYGQTPFDLVEKDNILNIFSEVIGQEEEQQQPQSPLKKPSAEKLNGKTESCCIIT